MKRTRLLLVNPAHSVSYWGFEYSVRLLGKRYSNAPLSLITIAAMCPDDWDVTVADENVEPIDLDTPCDLVGITAMNVQAARAFELAAAFRRRGRKVVIGGPFATIQPERCQPHFDVVFVGEAERTWPAFCSQLARGSHLRRYDQAANVDLAESPVPRYDLLRPGAYASIPIQATRGCPFACEFCDIIVMQGRKVRKKPVENVLRELDAAESPGQGSIFFVDDNFIGDPSYAGALLGAIAARNRRVGRSPVLFTQASVNLADKPDLLRRMVAAGFTRVFLGVESPRQASLREAHKGQNLRGDLVQRIHTIQRAGLITWAGMVVGFDHDDPAIFDEQAAFLERAGVAVAMVSMLNAPPKTPLFDRLAREGRIHPEADWADNCAWTNIVPRGMTRADLFRGYSRLVERLYRQESYAKRLLDNVERMDDPVPDLPPPGRGTPDLGALVQALRTFVWTRSAERRRHFFPNLFRVALRKPERLREVGIHLGLWHHFERYVPDLLRRVEAAARGASSRREVAEAVRDPRHLPMAQAPAD